MRSWGGSYALAAGTGAACTAGSFPLLTAPIGPLWLALAVLGFGLAMVTAATAREAMDVRSRREAEAGRSRRVVPASRRGRERTRLSRGRHVQARSVRRSREDGA